MANIEFENTAQGLCSVLIDNRHAANIATNPQGRWKLYAVRYVHRRPVIHGEEIDVTDIFYHHDKLRAAVQVLLTT